MLNSVPDKDEWMAGAGAPGQVQPPPEFPVPPRGDPQIPAAGLSETIEELLYDQEGVEHKAAYYQSQIDTIVSTGSALTFITCLAELIRHLAVERLHVIGDIYDRGSRCAHHPRHADGTPAGRHPVGQTTTSCGWGGGRQRGVHRQRHPRQPALRQHGDAGETATASASCRSPRSRWKPTRTTRANSSFLRFPGHNFHRPGNPPDGADAEGDGDHPVQSRGQVIKRRPHYQMDDRLLLDKIDYERGVIKLNGTEYPLLDAFFPTIDPKNPEVLTAEEQAVMERLVLLHQQQEAAAARALPVPTGSIYLAHDGNLLYHGCIAMNDDSGIPRLQRRRQVVRRQGFPRPRRPPRPQGYFATDNPEQNATAWDVMWFLWCAPMSPLFGKEKMTTFERYFIADKATHAESATSLHCAMTPKTPRARSSKEFGLDPDTGRIINGHVPVKVVKGERPIKANGRLIVIDGGFSRALPEADRHRRLHADLELARFAARRAPAVSNQRRRRSPRNRHRLRDGSHPLAPLPHARTLTAGGKSRIDDGAIAPTARF